MKTTQEATIQMMQFITAKWISKPIYVAAKLGIADLLAEGPRTVEEIAQKKDLYAPYLYRVMRALAGFGIFYENENKTFELTPMAECLKTGALRSIALMFLSDWHDRAWDKLLHSVKTGEIAFHAAHGMSCFDWLKANPEAAEIYHHAQSIKAMTSHRTIIDSYNFSGINSLTDIGGGYGGLMIEILKAHPSMRGVITDVPSVIRETRKIIEAHGLEKRCSTADRDFFRDIPSGSDAYILSHILHDWEDAQCQIILKNCHEAMDHGSRLLIVEMIVPTGNEPSISKLLDLEVLVMGGGRERTEVEFYNLIEASGFNLNRIIPTQENISIIECLKK
jgi:hypothetical protein